MSAPAVAPAAAAVPPPVQGEAPSPGRELVRALAGASDASASDSSGEVALDLPVTLTTTFPFFAARPRYTVRHLLGTRTVDGGADRATFVREPVRADTPAESGTSYNASPEAAFEPVLADARLTDVRVSVPLPAGLVDHPELLAAHVDRRVVVRLCTAENEVLLHGSADGAVQGLLKARGLRAVRGRGRIADDVAWAAAMVEETGGSCDGIVVHPDVYWALALDGRLAHLNAAGVRVSRTRMIARHQALFADFRAVATLLDPSSSRLVLRRGGGDANGNGNGNGRVDTIEASCRVGLAIHLPQHLVLVDFGEAPQ
jgi:hypothetical protein